MMWIMIAIGVAALIAGIMTCNSSMPEPYYDEEDTDNDDEPGGCFCIATIFMCAAISMAALLAFIKIILQHTTT